MADFTQLLSQFLYGRLAQIGGSGGSAAGVLTVSTATYTTAGTSAEDAWTYSLPANTLSTDGRIIRITAWGDTAGNANSKTLAISFGGTTLRTYTSTNQGAWVCHAHIVRTGASAQIGWGGFLTSTVAELVSMATPAETLSGAVTIKITLTTPTAAGDVTFRGAFVELLN